MNRKAIGGLLLAAGALTWLYARRRATGAADPGAASSGAGSPSLKMALASGQPAAAKSIGDYLNSILGAPLADDASPATSGLGQLVKDLVGDPIATESGGTLPSASTAPATPQQPVNLTLTNVGSPTVEDSGAQAVAEFAKLAKEYGGEFYLTTGDYQLQVAIPNQPIMPVFVETPTAETVYYLTMDGWYPLTMADVLTASLPEMRAYNTQAGWLPAKPGLRADLSLPWVYIDEIKLGGLASMVTRHPGIFSLTKP